MQTNGIVEMELKRIVIDETRLEQIVVLKERTGDRTLPIVIGASEAAAIKLEVSGIHPQRPMTHDLLRETIDGLGAKLEKIVIDKLENNTFYAKLHLKNEKNSAIVIDARPSDSIALAIRAKSPIFVAKEVLEKVGKLDEDK
ncbi:MAG: bifunctional nuclease family protein [Candidatus Omnitrophota bacterium]